MLRQVANWIRGKWRRTERDDLLRAYQVTFHSPHGQIVLQHLLDEIYCQVCPSVDAISLAMHNGRRSVIQEIMENLDLADAPDKYITKSLEGIKV